MDNRHTLRSSGLIWILGLRSFSKWGKPEAGVISSSAMIPEAPETCHHAIKMELRRILTMTTKRLRCMHMALPHQGNALALIDNSPFFTYDLTYQGKVWILEWGNSGVAQFLLTHFLLWERMAKSVLQNTVDVCSRIESYSLPARAQKARVFLPPLPIPYLKRCKEGRWICTAHDYRRESKKATDLGRTREIHRGQRTKMQLESLH